MSRPAAVVDSPFRKGEHYSRAEIASRLLREREGVFQGHELGHENNEQGAVEIIVLLTCPFDKAGVPPVPASGWLDHGGRGAIPRIEETAESNDNLVLDR